jgi:hypothetical protein
MRSGMRVAAMGGIAALVAAGTAACGSGGGSSSGGSHSASAAASANPEQAVQTAYTTSSSQKTAAFRLDETVSAKSSSGSTRNTTITGSGQVDLGTGAFRLSVNPASGGTTTALQSAGMEYVQVPAAQRSQVPGRKPWVSVNLNQVSQAKLGTSFSQLSSLNSDNPAQALGELSAMSSSVTKTGTTTIDGVPVTVYRAEVNLDKVASQLQAKAGTKAAQAIRQEASELGTSTFPVRVWVDAHHLVRQVSTEVPIPASSGSSSGHGTATETITFYGYGGPVQVTPPPTAQTVNITSEVLQQANSSSGG